MYFDEGTMGELTPVREIDGRLIGWGESAGKGAGPNTRRLQVRRVIMDNF